MAAESAGILLHKREGRGLLVLLVHPGGPFWRNKDLGSWSIPKGLIAEGEKPLAAARREFTEETGHRPRGKFAAWRSEAAGRKAGPGMGCGRRLGCGFAEEQYVRDGMAAAIRPEALISRTRPGGMV